MQSVKQPDNLQKFQNKASITISVQLDTILAVPVITHIFTAESDLGGDMSGSKIQPNKVKLVKPFASKQKRALTVAVFHKSVYWNCHTMMGIDSLRK